MAIEYIKDDYLNDGKKDSSNVARAVLWRTGDYQYQIEVSGPTIETKQFNFEMEYYKALEIFDNFIKSN